MSMKQKYGLEKSPTRRIGFRMKGSSDIGVMLIAFMFFIFILLPLILNVCEIKSAQESIERARLAAELSASEMVLELNAERLSEGKFEWDSDFEKKFFFQIQEKFKDLNIKGEIESLSLRGQFTEEKPSLKIYFKWQYVPIFLKNNFYQRYLEVHYVYEFPIL